MSRIQRFVVALVLAVALPFQGVAAATMAACGPSHHLTDGMAQAHSDFGHGQSEAVTGSHDHASPHSLESRLDGEPAQADHQALHGGSHNAPKYKCSSCVSCCTSTAIPSPLVFLESAALPESFAYSEPSGVAAFLGEGLERPPRIVLA
jgi:hypothetical protein